MNDYHKELLTEIINEWPIERVEIYIMQLEERLRHMDDWIKHLKVLKKKRTRKRAVDTGVRGGL